MNTYFVTITLERETTFGRGDGLAGLVDEEVVHDAHGFPFLRGRTLKGLLSEECDGVVALLKDSQRWNAALHRLFGSAGSTDDVQALWRYGDATLPHVLRTVVAAQQDPKQPANLRLTSADVLGALTAIRSQTAISAASGTPDDGSLRSSRVAIRGLTFTSRLATPAAPKDDPALLAAHEDDLALLAAGCLALRHVGEGRTRGRGLVRCALLDANQQDITLARLTMLREVPA